ncbi:MAG: hypothetical protein ACI9BF_000351 [Candidatus Paceibacteria bacterium]|jgi:hypothetical protein
MEDYYAPKKMKKVGDFFDKYRKKFKAPQASVEKACASVIKEVTGYEVKEECVSYTVSTRTISLQIPSVLKSELRFHYPLILKKTEDLLGKEGSPKVIL